MLKWEYSSLYWYFTQFYGVNNIQIINFIPFPPMCENELITPFFWLTSSLSLLILSSLVEGLWYYYKYYRTESLQGLIEPQSAGFHSTNRSCRLGVQEVVTHFIYSKNMVFVRDGDPQNMVHVRTVCPRSLDPLYIVSYLINWVKTSWT